MKATSLNPPYGSLIAVAASHPALGKAIETRSWATSYRGPIAIHQTAGLGAIFTSEAELWDLCLSEPFRTALEAIGILNPARLPRGAIVAVADLVGCFPIMYMERQWGYVIGTRRADQRFVPVMGPELSFGLYMAGRYAWQLANITALPEPIPARGLPGFWDWQPPAGFVLP